MGSHIRAHLMPPIRQSCDKSKGFRGALPKLGPIMPRDSSLWDCNTPGRCCFSNLVRYFPPMEIIFQRGLLEIKIYSKNFPQSSKLTENFPQVFTENINSTRNIFEKHHFKPQISSKNTISNKKYLLNTSFQTTNIF